MRAPNWGTPGRSKQFLNPRSKYAFLLPSLALGFLLGGALLLAHALGARRPVSPGDLIGAHERIDRRCEECHAPHQGASNLRCQRCHDPAGAGRMTNAAHVLFGSRSAKQAAAAPLLQCAGCHVDHQGRRAQLTLVDENHCRDCHFRSFDAHPEFAVLRVPTHEAPGIAFSHVKHLEELQKQLGLARKDACLKCHEMSPRGRDFDAISFDRQCASCHAKSGSLGAIDPVSLQDVAAPEAVPRLPTPGDGEFETARGRITKTRVRHRDEWVLYNLNRLRRDAEPEAWAGERGALLARLSQLRRRLALATPLAALDEPALRSREVALQIEIRGAEARIKALLTGNTPFAGLLRVEEALATSELAASQGLGGEARQLKERAAALKRLAAATPTALPAADYASQRKQVLALLEAVDAADPRLKSRVDDLRRRLLALAPGEDGAELLGRVRDQRKGELERVRDEIALRAEGIAPPAAALLVGQRRAAEDAIAAIRLRLDALGPALPSSVSPEDRERKRDVLAALAAPCTKCHLLAGGALAPVSASKPVLVRARFVHQPHLMQTDADCSRCHPSIDKSKLSKDLNLKGIETCHECHRNGGTTADCQSCHRYHAPAVP